MVFHHRNTPGNIKHAQNCSFHNKGSWAAVKQGWCLSAFWNDRSYHCTYFKDNNVKYRWCSLKARVVVISPTKINIEHAPLETSKNYVVKNPESIRNYLP
jgi:hypothetical protein